MENSSLSEEVPPAVEVEQQNSDYLHLSANEEEPPVVAAEKEPAQLPLNITHQWNYHHNRYQQQGLKCALPFRSRSRPVEFPLSRSYVECLGTWCGLLRWTLPWQSPT